VYREQPLMSIWEGSGNVIALDVLRALARTPAALGVFFEEIGLAAGGLKDMLAGTVDPGQARRVVERMALVLQGSLVVRHAPAEVADAFCASRLAGDWGHTFGTLSAGTDSGAIVERAAPA
jgi:putative acyl-CoA dehydrogenase